MYGIIMFLSHGNYNPLTNSCGVVHYNGSLVYCFYF